MSAPFLTFLNIPTPLHQDDFNTHDEYHLPESPSSLTTTTYIAIVSRHGKTFTKVLNPSSIANTSDGFSSSSLRGRKRALSGSGNASSFFNPLLLKQSSSLQKKTKFFLFSWSLSSKRNNSIEQQQRRSSNELTSLTTTGCSFHKLPTEILIRILHHLNTAANVLQVAQTSRYFYNICYDHHLWHQLFSKQYYPLLTPPSEQCFNLYKDHVELDKRWARGDAHVSYMNNEDEHDDSVYATAWINSQTIATVSRDRSIKLWDIETRNCLFTRKDAHQGSILCLTLMQPQQEEDTGGDKKNEIYAVTGSSDSTCIVWSLPNWNQVRQFSAHTHSVLSVLAINDAMVATASRDTTIQIWRITDGKVCHVLRGHTEAVNAVKQLDNQRIVSASGDGTVKIWCTKTGVCLETLTSDIGGLSCMQVINNRTIWAGGLSSHIQIWESITATNDSVWKTATVINSGHTNLLRTIDSLKGKVITAGYDRVIKVWDSETGKCLLNFQSGHTSKIFSVLLGRTNIISAGHDKRIMVLDFAHQLSKELAR